MVHTAFDPNDPRLTAWLLGELSTAERDEFERYLDIHPEARAEIELLRVACDEVRGALAAEEVPPLEAAVRTTILAAADHGSLTSAEACSPAVPPQRNRWRALISVGVTLASCAVLIALVTQPSDIPQPDDGDQARPIAVMLSRARDELQQSSLKHVATNSEPAPVSAGRELSLNEANVPVRRWDGSTKPIALTSTSPQSGEHLDGIADPLVTQPAELEFTTVDEALSERTIAPVRGSRERHFASSGDRLLVDGEVDSEAKTHWRALNPEARGRMSQLLKRSDERSKRLAESRPRSFTDEFMVARAIPPRDLDLATTLDSSPPEAGDEEYAAWADNPFLTPQAAPLSTFGVDVDTASYANVRRFLNAGQLPPPQAVRIEELLNYFRYDDQAPAGPTPFSVTVESGRCPWNSAHRLVRIGLAGREVPPTERPAANLVFLIDVSGSMEPENKLPLVKASLNLLLRRLNERDRLAIVTYSDTARLVLPSTPVTNLAAIQATIDSLRAAGSTNGADGIRLAYNQAVHHFVDQGINRVILCTDGDFNVGTTSDDELIRLIEERRRSQVFFSVYGYGMGNLKDGKLEKLADHGNGHYGYIDGAAEARKSFVEEAEANLLTIAQDVKVQVEFNPAQVGEYRLIGYENRILAAADFRNDRVDAGDLGAGHRVTALYEIIPPTAVAETKTGPTLRYGTPPAAAQGPLAQELLTVRLRYKNPGEETSQEFETPYAEEARPASRNLQWSAAVAAFGLLLRHSPHRGEASVPLILELAESSVGDDPHGHRREFVQLVHKAAPALASQTTRHPSREATGEELLSPAEAERIASQNGKYSNLLRVLRADGDREAYGSVRDYGRWDGRDYLGHASLPQGYWVYVAPNWYIWGDLAK